MVSPGVITEDVIIKLFKTPGHPIAFSAPTAISRYFNGTVPMSTIKSALQKVESYTLHREYKQPSVYNPYYAYLRRSQFQADLIDVAQLAASNDNVTFLLIIIDVFTRKIWVMPLKRKTGVQTRNALSAWLRAMNSQDSFPKSILTDSGKEFLNAPVRELMRANSVTMMQAKNINKAAIVERANKSLQIIIYKYLTEKGEAKYIDVLPLLVQTYNKRAHRTLQHFSPNAADDEKNEVKIRSIHLQRYQKINAKRKKTKPPFEKGNTVRIKTYATGVSSARRAYLQQFKGELFKIINVRLRMPVVMYELRSMNDEEAVEGGFYSNELVRVQGDIFQVEKILRRRGRGRHEKLFVKWKYFDDKWNSWIKASDVQT